MTSVAHAKNSPGDEPFTTDPPPIQSIMQGEPHPDPTLQTPLQITSVRWGLTVHTGNYSSARLDAEANVPTGTLAEYTLRELQEWVRSQSPLSESERDHVRRQQEIFWEDTRTFEAAKLRVESDWELLRQFCAAHGLQVPKPHMEDLPF